MGLKGYNGEDTTHGVKELAEKGDSVTLITGSAKVGNGEHDTTLHLSKVWDRPGHFTRTRRPDPKPIRKNPVRVGTDPIKLPYRVLL